MAGGGGTGGKEVPQALKASASWARRQTDVTNSDCSFSNEPSSQKRVRPSSAPLLGFGNGRPLPPDPPLGSPCDLSGLSSTMSLGPRNYHRCCTDITMLDGVSPYYSYTNFDSSAETANRARQRHNFMQRSLYGSFNGEAELSTSVVQHLDSTSVGTLLGGSCCAGALQRRRRERSLLGFSTGDLPLDLSHTVKLKDADERMSEAAATPSTVSVVTSHRTMEASDTAHATPTENRGLERSSADGGNNLRSASRPSSAHPAVRTTATQRPSTAARLRRPASAASVRSNNSTPKAAAIKAAKAAATSPQRPISAVRNPVTGLPQHVQVCAVPGNSGTAKAATVLRPDVGIKGLLRRGGGRREGSREQRKPDQRRLPGGATRNRAQARRERPRGMTHCSSAPCLSLL